MPDTGRPNRDRLRGALTARLRRRAREMVAAYVVFAGLWILLSDRILGLIVSDPERLIALSVFKGAFFVAVTGALLLFLLRRLLARVGAGEALLEGQNRILAAVAEGRPLAESLDDLVRFIESHAPDMMCSVLLLDAEGKRVLHGAGPSLPTEYMAVVDGSEIGPMAGSCGTAAFTRAPVYVRDIETDPRWAAYKHLALPHGLRACWSTPIFDAGSNVLGTFAMYYDRPALPRRRDRHLISIATQLAAVAIGRTKTEAALRESEARFHSFMDASPAIAWVTDDQGRHLYMNRAWSALFGKERDAFAGHRAEELVGPEAARRIEASDAEVLRRNAPLQVPEDKVEFGGKTYWWNTVKFPFESASGERLLGGMAIDISRRKSMEGDLRELQARLEVVVENLSEGLIIADPAGDFLHWNPAALRMLGYANPEEGRQHQREFARFFEVSTLDGELLPPERWPLARVRRGESIQGLEVHVRRLDGDWERIFSYSGARVQTAEAHTLAFVTLNDVTERRRTERLLRELNTGLELRVEQRTAELRAALERAESADRLKSAFLATMSHELRTPLNSIIGFTGIVLQKLAGPLNDEQARQLEMVRGSARHLLALINDVLDLSKIEAGQLEMSAETFALPPMLERVLSSLRPQAEKKGLTLAMDLAAAPATLHTDRRRVEQVLLNLLSNAVKFTEVGEVRMTVCEIPLALRDGQSTPGVRFDIRDTGPGIAEHDQAALFLPFRQLDTGLSRRHEGTGLGLSICRRLAGLLGGEIGVQSSLGQGSTFSVTVPIHLPGA
jgi:PAS domain S-box-containing protein